MRYYDYPSLQMRKSRHSKVEVIGGQLFAELDHFSPYKETATGAKAIGL